MITKSKSETYVEWCRSPWGLVILVVLAIAFGGHVTICATGSGNLFMTISTGVMLFSHLALILIGLRKKDKDID